MDEWLLKSIMQRRGFDVVSVTDNSSTYSFHNSETKISVIVNRVDKSYKLNYYVNEDITLSTINISCIDENRMFSKIYLEFKKHVLALRQYNL